MRNKRCNPMAPTSAQIVHLHIMDIMAQFSSPTALQPYPSQYNSQLQAINDVQKYRQCESKIRVSCLFTECQHPSCGCWQIPVQVMKIDKGGALL